MTVRSRALVCLVFLLSASGEAFAQTGSLDVTQWRGRNRDGAASGFKEPAAWPAELRQRWAIQIGEGYATPLVVGPRASIRVAAGGNLVMTLGEAGA